MYILGMVNMVVGVKSTITNQRQKIEKAITDHDNFDIGGRSHKLR